MPGTAPHRKRVKHFHQPGDLHEFTFSCYRRMKLLTNNTWRAKLSESIDKACQAVGCFLAAFVYMPEHVHLLVWGIQAKEDVSELLSRIKQPVSVQVHADLAQRQSRLLARLMVRDRPGRQVFRFWQEGPGFDRNLFTIRAVQASIDYIHHNPVTGGGQASASTNRMERSSIPCIPRLPSCRRSSGTGRESPFGNRGVLGATSCQKDACGSWVMDDRSAVPTVGQPDSGTRFVAAAATRPARQWHPIRRRHRHPPG